jgi:hypothetical protein
MKRPWRCASSSLGRQTSDKDKPEKIVRVPKTVIHDDYPGSGIHRQTTRSNSDKIQRRPRKSLGVHPKNMLARRSVSVIFEDTALPNMLHFFRFQESKRKDFGKYLSLKPAALAIDSYRIGVVKA